MKTNSFRGLRLLVAAVLAGAALVLSGCYGIPQGTAPSMKVGTVSLQAVGAGLVQADAQTTTFKIKCEECGYEPATITIPTPAPGKPYVLDWVCPKCGHQQKITIRAEPASPVVR